MVVLVVLAALSMAAIVVLIGLCERQLRATQHATRVLVLPYDERRAFDEIVAPLLADPEFGRVDS